MTNADAIVGPGDVAAANSLLYDTFHPDEPVTRHLGLTAPGRQIPDADRMVIKILNLAEVGAKFKITFQTCGTGVAQH